MNIVQINEIWRPEMNVNEEMWLYAADAAFRLLRENKVSA